MPNTLAHFGGQGPLTRLAGVTVDAKWVLLGCVLPDVPWIVRRVVTVAGGGMVDPVALRLYAIVQASLIFSILLAAAVSLLSARPGPVFGALALGAVLHLLLDAAQTRWGNGVHFFAPVSWETVNFGWFWPESWVTAALAAAGVAFLAWEWIGSSVVGRIPVAASRGRALTAVALAGAYLISPPVFTQDVLASGSHAMDVLTSSDRVGSRVELDRVGYRPSGPGEPGAPMLVVTGGEIEATGRLPSRPGTLSVRGVFVDAATLRVQAYHVHAAGTRDLASYLGLLALAVVWIRDVATERRTGREEGST